MVLKTNWLKNQGRWRVILLLIIDKIETIRWKHWEFFLIFQYKYDNVAEPMHKRVIHIPYICQIILEGGLWKTRNTSIYFGDDFNYNCK